MNRYLALMRRVLLGVCAAVPLATVSAPASAAALGQNFLFQGSGILVFDPTTSSGSWLGDFDSASYPDLTSRVVYSFDKGTGALQGTLEFFPLLDLANSLIGRVDAQLLSGSFDEGGSGVLSVNYTVESGTGEFGGATGGGSSTLNFGPVGSGFADFTEAGSLAVAIAAVPEPTGLALTGVALLALLATRRKAAPLN